MVFERVSLVRAMEQVVNTFRVVFEGDFITGIPKLLWVYKHVGIEVEIDRFGNMIVDPSFVEKQFRVSSRRRFASHSMYAYRSGLRACRRQLKLPLPSERMVTATPRLHGRERSGSMGPGVSPTKQAADRRASGARRRSSSTVTAPRNTEPQGFDGSPAETKT